MDAHGVDVGTAPEVQVYVATIGPETADAAFRVVVALRRASISADMDYRARSIRAQMKTADRLGVLYTVLIGEDELAQAAATVRDMRDGTQETMPLTDLASRLAAYINTRPES